MPSKVDICNRALQKLGAKRITSLSEATVSARAMNMAYEPVKKALLRSHLWSFAISRAELAADATEPDWGRANSYQLPSDFLRLAEDYNEDVLNDRDWEIEGDKILTDDTSPIYIRYVKDVTDPNEFDALFAEALSTNLAYECCEELTQSNTKKEGLAADLKRTLMESRRCNAIEKQSKIPAEDTYITCRS